jgi:serine phosphatase RsbU (regulator of sigma subunit)
MLFIVGMHLTVNGQAPFDNNIKAYQDAVQAKEYGKASLHAYEIASYLYENKELSKAIDYSNESLTYAKKSKDSKLLFFSAYQLATYNSEAKKYIKALEHFQTALGAAEKLNDQSLIKGTLINISSSYGSLERYKKSIESAEEALSLALTSRDTVLQQKCYHLLTEYHTKQGNNKKALEYQAQLDLLFSIQQNDAQKRRKIDELEQHVQTVGLENLATNSKLAEQNKKLLQTHASLRTVERNLHMTTESLLATTDSLKVIDAISKGRQLEIDLLQKDKELASIKISEQQAHIETEKLTRKFTLVGSLLSAALVAVLVISYRKKSKDNKKIARQNKNIQSSINYAKRIQEAMLPKVEQHPYLKENSFILFKPRDTVSGDFYWMSDIKTGNNATPDIGFAAVDCTGHGVPGAFMSMIGLNALNGLINQGISEPHQILSDLDKEIRTALRQETTGNNDGMDVALCIYRPKIKILEFAGAKNPLVYIQNNELFQIKGDVHSIGGLRRTGEFSFKKHQITIDKPTVIYLFSDGYKHQFGGMNNKKYSARNLTKLLFEIHQLPMEEQKNILQTTIEAWKGDQEQTDDILVMGLKVG